MNPILVKILEYVDDYPNDELQAECEAYLDEMFAESVVYRLVATKGGIRHATMIREVRSELDVWAQHYQDLGCEVELFTITVLANQTIQPEGKSE